MALRPHLQHRCVIITLGLPDIGGAQRRNGNRAGIAGIVLAAVSRRQQPHPGSQLRLHVQYPLTRRQQLLGQQMAHTVSAPAAQARSGHACAHASNCSAWAAQARTRSSPSHSSVALIATAVCEALCGSIPMITADM